ncbi:MAG: sigma 54-interacting transcriptional regulator [Negativicutes bacterium]|nr:sigma 54-interacting transcriptional regulator [Negativicutes bacterium]
MNRELTVGDIAARRILPVEAELTLAKGRVLLASGEWDALAVAGQGRWGYVTAEGCAKDGDSLEAAADFALVVRDENFLGRPVAAELPLLVGWAVMVFAEGKPVALHTPRLFAESLVRLLREQQVITAAVLDTVSEAVTVIDTHQRVIGWNSRAEQLYGFAAKEILGKPISEFFSNLVVTGIMQEPQAVKDKYHRPRAGAHVLINAAPLELDGTVIGGISAERDITELVNLNRELSRASQEVLSLKEEIGKISSQADPFAAVCGHSEEILDAVKMGRRIAAAGVPVLIRGESGTGKEIFARALHASSRRSGAFVEINCGAIPANLFESELFGYQPGAFTGADRKGKPGLFETANGGTLFLDEIGELPKEMQVKLLRVLQDKSFYRIGGDRAISVDVRIIAATHRNLEEMIAQNQFRDDLYYRLNVVTLQLPPLRDRRGDIPELVHRGLQNFGSLHGKQISRVEPAVMAVFLDYDWPGNVRELHNILERLVVLADGETLGVANLPAALRPSGKAPAPTVADGASLELMTDAMARDLIEAALKAAGYNKAIAAKSLGIPRSTLYYKMNHLGINGRKLTKVSENGRIGAV